MENTKISQKKDHGGEGGGGGGAAEKIPINMVVLEFCQNFYRTVGRLTNTFPKLSSAVCPTVPCS